jgi:hypothetical protein
VYIALYPQASQYSTSKLNGIAINKIFRFNLYKLKNIYYKKKLNPGFEPGSFGLKPKVLTTTLIELIILDYFKNHYIFELFIIVNIHFN